MHIRSAAMSTQSINLYGAAQSERAAAAQSAAQRANEVRRRLLKSAQSVAVDADPDATLLIGQWLDSRHSQVLLQDGHSAASGKDPDFG
jgi:hypothetical protein